MTTDDFTTAARAEAKRHWLDGPDAPSPQEMGAHMAEWARTYLAEQEPTDGEVLAALNAHDPTVSTPNLGHYAPSHVEQMRAALTAARAARRDEEKR